MGHEIEKQIYQFLIDWYNSLPTEQQLWKKFDKNEFNEQKTAIYKAAHPDYGSVHCDIAFKTKNLIVLIEVENTHRPVESISKYWRLFAQTNWLKTENPTNIPMRYCIIFPPGSNSHKYQERIDQVKLIGQYLATKYEPFEFKNLELREDNKDILIYKLNELVNL